MSFPISPTEGEVYNNYEYNNGAWKVAVTNKAAVCTKMQLSVSQTKASGWSVLNFDSYIYNDDSLFTYLGSYKHKPLKAGRFRISVTGYSNSNSATANVRYAIGAYKNGALDSFTGGTLATSDSPLTGYSGILTFNGTTDYLEIRAYSPSTMLFAGANAGAGHQMRCDVEYLGEV